MQKTETTLLEYFEGTITYVTMLNRIGFPFDSEVLSIVDEYKSDYQYSLAEGEDPYCQRMILDIAVFECENYEFPEEGDDIFADHERSELSSVQKYF